MKIKRFLIQFVTIFALSFVTNTIVVYLWNLLRHGEGAFDWGLSLTFAIVLGIVLPIVMAKMSKEK